MALIQRLPLYAVPCPRRSLSGPSSDIATQLCRISSTNAGQRRGGGISSTPGCGWRRWAEHWVICGCGYHTCENEVREISRPTLCSIHIRARGISFPPSSYLHPIQQEWNPPNQDTNDRCINEVVIRMRTRKCILSHARISHLPPSVELGLSAGVEEEIRVSVAPSVPLHHTLPVCTRIGSRETGASPATAHLFRG